MPEPQQGKTLEQLQAEGIKFDDAAPTPGPKMSASASPIGQPYLALPPSQVDAAGMRKVSTPASERFMNTPLVNVTGNPTLNQFFSPANIALLGPSALSAVRGAVGELSSTVGVPLTKKLMNLVTPSIFKKPGQLLEVVQELTTAMKNRGGALAETGAPPSQTVSQPVAPPEAPPAIAPPPPQAPPPQAPPAAAQAPAGAPPGPPPGQPPGPTPPPPPGPTSAGGGPMEGAPGAPGAPPPPPPPGAGGQPAAPPQASIAAPQGVPAPAVKPAPHPTSANGPQPKQPPQDIGLATSERFKAAAKVFKDLGVEPLKSELANATDMARWGKSIEQAVRDVLAKRSGGAPPVDPAAELAKMLGSPTDAQVAASRVRSKR